jgi:hypothetical protein
MAKFTITDKATVEPAASYPAPFATCHGAVTARRVSPAEYPTWLIDAELSDGTTLRWPDQHGDEAVYVVAGALEVDGRICPADGCVVVEANVAASARAIGPTQIVHVGPVDPNPPKDGLYGAPEPEGHHVHVVGPGGWFASGGRENVVARWFADSTCATCRLSFFHVARTDGLVKDLPHTHTQDEIIYILGGSVIIGRHEYGPGHAIAIPANIRYTVTTGPNGMAFLNYRRDVSTQAYGKVKPPELEGGIARGGTEVRDFVGAG